MAQSGRHRDPSSLENRNGSAAHSTSDGDRLRSWIIKTRKNGSERLNRRSTQREGRGEKHHVGWSVRLQCSHDDGLVSRGTFVGWEFGNDNPWLRLWTIDRYGQQ